MDGKGFQFIGFMTVSGIAIALVLALQTCLHSTGVAESLSAMNPWIGRHRDTLYWISAAVVILTAMAVNLILMMRDTADGENSLSKLGRLSTVLFFVYGLIMLMPSIGFLIGVGWFGAKQLFSP